MNTYIVLFRGINVSGQKKMLMAELRDLLSEIGFNKVLTYIQSGNIVLKSEMTASEVEERIHTAILSHFGYDVPIVVRTPYEIQKIIDACPHHGEKKEKSYFTVLKTEPSQEAIEELQKIDYPNEEIVVTKACVYGFFALGAGKAKFNNNLVEQKLKVQATSRNFRTMMKLLSLSLDID